jgi:hypothetical protein
MTSQVCFQSLTNSFRLTICLRMERRGHNSYGAKLFHYPFSKHTRDPRVTNSRLNPMGTKHMVDVEFSELLCRQRLFARHKLHPGHLC